jgi:hypothetical protein
MHSTWVGAHVPLQTPSTHVWLVHAAGVPHWPSAPHVSTPLFEHFVAPTAHTPVHAPATHVWLTQPASQPAEPSEVGRAHRRDVDRGVDTALEHCRLVRCGGAIVARVAVATVARALGERREPLDHAAGRQCPTCEDDRREGEESPHGRQDTGEAAAGPPARTDWEQW